MERPLTDLKLKASGYTAKIVKFFLHSEARELDAKQWEGATIAYGATGIEVKDIPVDYRQKQDDTMLLIGIKALTNADGVGVDVTKEVIDSLPEVDIQHLLIELGKARFDQEESKKK